jgi:hypothetical protein
MGKTFQKIAKKLWLGFYMLEKIITINPIWKQWRFLEMALRISLLKKI